MKNVCRHAVLARGNQLTILLLATSKGFEIEKYLTCIAKFSDLSLAVLCVWVQLLLCEVIC